MIGREPQKAAATTFDLIVVGGGIYGVCLTLEAARRGMKPLLLERDDYGQHTSWNSLRILHGGLRYLQNLDVRRLFDSVRERDWFLNAFPDLVRPLPCLMPLYGRGLRRRSVLRVALMANDLLSLPWNRRKRDPVDRLPRGRVLSTEEAVARFPAVDRIGLQGGALWYDAFMPEPQRVLVEMLHRACALGAVTLNYVEAEELEVDSGRVVGVHGRDRTSGTGHLFSSEIVVNCCGPWAGDVAQRFDRDAPALFRPSLAFNLLIDREPPFETAVAVSSGYPGGQTFFLCPWEGKILAGTYHGPVRDQFSGKEPDEAQIGAFLEQISLAVPELVVKPAEVLRVFSGLLPVVRAGTVELSTREVIWDHGSANGPDGFYSVSGVKFTTARLVAERALRKIRWHHARSPAPAGQWEPWPTSEPPSVRKLEELLSEDPEVARTVLLRMVREESVIQLSDLLLRRTSWGVLSREAEKLERQISDLLSWSDPTEANGKGHSGQRP
jgi:glycerol-3-phosphate dehydrogenase